MYVGVHCAGLRKIVDSAECRVIGLQLPPTKWQFLTALHEHTHAPSLSAK